MTTFIFAWGLVAMSNWYLYSTGWKRMFGSTDTSDKWFLGVAAALGPCATPAAIWVYLKGEK